MAPDLLSRKGEAQRAYELGRLRHAIGWSVPALLLGGMVASVVREVSFSLVFGLALYVASTGLLWWGRAAGRSVLPGVAYGLVPLIAGVIAKVHGHMCMGTACVGMCMPLCVGGGVLAGLLVARLAARSDNPTAVFLSGASTAFLTGAIGGSCIGLHGVIGMAIGIAFGVLPLLALRFSKRR